MLRSSLRKQLSVRWWRQLLLIALATLNLIAPALAQESLGHARDVLDLPLATAERKIPVSLRGVVTYFKPEGIPDLIIQDDTAGIFVTQTEGLLPTGLQPGSVVEIGGVTAPGLFVPRVSGRKITIVGQTELPNPINVSYDDLRSGRFDSQYVEVSGVVRAATVDRQLLPHRLILKLATPAGQVEAWLLHFGADDGSRLVDTSVRVRGVCLYWTNSRRQLTNLRLLVNDLQSVRIQRTMATDPYDAPQVQLDDLLRYHPKGTDQHRLRVRGVVTLCRPGEYVVVASEKVAAKIRLTQAPVQIGDKIEAVGFAGMSGYSAELQDAVCRVLAHPGPPPAAFTTPRQVLENPNVEDWDQRLIEVKATFRAQRKSVSETTLLLESEGVAFSASLPHQSALPWPTELVPGSVLKVAGICECAIGELGRARGGAPETFSLILRDASDIVVLRRGPWLNVQRLLIALGIGAGILMAALLWAFTLKRKVERRTAHLAREIRARHDAGIEFHAVMQERSRMAGELHDTLEQSLTGVSLQLQAAELAVKHDPGQTQANLAQARQMLDRSRKEIRVSVWNLRTDGAQKTNLRTELEEIASAMALGGSIRITVHADPISEVIPEVITNHLLRIGQEALTNAIKHSRARNIRLELRLNAGQLMLKVEDDGIGFDPAACPGLTTGHFGLAGMQERASRLGSNLNMQTSRGKGTAISVSTALSPTPSNP